nr:ADP-glucose pyrophosphorylase small subunit 2 [Ipomoea batatas]GMC82145.1 ADP-glucose pyrophosphorylase small subunit 2 [Ipomoea batatas]
MAAVIGASKLTLYTCAVERNNASARRAASRSGGKSSERSNAPIIVSPKVVSDKLFVKRLIRENARPPLLSPGTFPDSIKVEEPDSARILNGKCYGAEERGIYRVENGLNLLSLGRDEAFPGDGGCCGDGSWIARVCLDVVLREDDGGDTALGSIPHGNSVPSYLPWDSLNCEI